MFRMAILILSGMCLIGGSRRIAAAGRSFPSAEAAAHALVTAARNGNPRELIGILGSGADRLLSPDPAADRTILRDFAAGAARKILLVPCAGHRRQRVLLTGDHQWPLPFLIVEVGGKWYFDTARGSTNCTAN